MDGFVNGELMISQYWVDSYLMVSVCPTERCRSSHSKIIAYLEIQVFLVDLADLLDLAILDRPVHLDFLNTMNCSRLYQIIV